MSVGGTMIIIERTLDFEIEAPLVCAIGKFDGIHRGHAELFRRMEELRRTGLKTCVLTFSVSPAAILSGEDPSACGSLLTTNAEKQRILSELGVDYYVELPFDEKLRQMSASDFVERILLTKLNTKAVVCGTDCRFGYRGLGTAEYLSSRGAACGFSVTIVDKVQFRGREISSSYIRDAVEQGDLETANAMLIRPYLFYGEVVHGQRIGRTLGFPTVNLMPEYEKLLPKKGVYFSKVHYLDRDYPSITNIGSKPTVAGDRSVAGVESYLYDFHEEIYGEKVFVSLYQFLRSERKFADLDALRLQLQKDIAAGERWHRRNP